MDDSHSSNSVSNAGDFPVLSPVKRPSSPIVRLGGLLGIVGTIVGLLVLFLGCGGVDRVMPFSRVAVALGAAGLVFTVFGAFVHRRRLVEDTHVLQAMFACIISVAGGLLEMAAWLNWSMFK